MQAYERYRTLDLYFGSYLHQDWMYEFADPDEAYETLLALLRPDDLRKMIEEFGAVLVMDDSGLSRTVEQLSHYLNPRSDLGLGEREWLQSLRDRAAAELAARTASGG